ncbi:MAG: DUF721 domain-containing protein [Breznakibacter sp.]
MREFLESNNRLSKGLLETQVLQNWGKILGPSVERHTQKIYLSNGVLFVHLDSSVARNELVMLKEKIVRSLNQSVGANIVTDIVFR